MKTRVNLAGVQFSDYLQLDGKEFYKEIKSKSGKLKMYWDKNNKFDKKAIAVKLGSTRIGYIPKGGVQAELWKAREAGNKSSIKLVSYNPTNPTWHMFTVELDIPIIIDEEDDWDYMDLMEMV
jgi:hypothetical protein